MGRLAPAQTEHVWILAIKPGNQIIQAARIRLIWNVAIFMGRNTRANTPANDSP